MKGCDQIRRDKTTARFYIILDGRLGQFKDLLILIMVQLYLVQSYLLTVEITKFTILTVLASAWFVIRLKLKVVPIILYMDMFI